MQEKADSKRVPTAEEIEEAQGFCHFVNDSPTAFHSVSSIRARLDNAGFVYLPEGAAWHVEPGSKCYTVRNNSSIIAFKVGAQVSEEQPYHFQVLAAHGDSPALKLKATSEVAGCDSYVQLDAEPYGGMLDYTWFDRPLSVAGRLLVRHENRVSSRLVQLDHVARIPSLAIHLDRSQNESFSPHRERDLMPIVSAGLCAPGSFEACLAHVAGVSENDILARDLFLVSSEKASIWGIAHEFISGPRLDDLMCAYVALEAFLAATNPNAILVTCCFDNEEVGSNTKQGAMSTFLADTLQRLSLSLGASKEDYLRALAYSMLVSCDNAHAVHPNRSGLYDPHNRCHLNEGIVIKEAANQHYCTDAFSRAALIAILERAGIPYQSFANRSDMAGGSTLGNLSNIQASMHAVDVGCPQLAMHSFSETAGVRDVAFARRALEAFLSANVIITGAESIEIDPR